jgi:hypothetical protein
LVTQPAMSNPRAGRRWPSRMAKLQQRTVSTAGGQHASPWHYRVPAEVRLVDPNLTLGRTTIQLQPLWGHPMSSIPDWCNAKMPCLPSKSISGSNDT